MKNLGFLRSVLIVFLVISGCRKKDTAGTGGDYNLYVHVKHHSVEIDSATVFVKFNTSDAPDPSTAYDLSAVVSEQNGEKVAVFNGLKKGSYYLYSHGWDYTILEEVEGGLPYEIVKGDKRIDVTVQVTESGH